VDVAGGQLVVFQGASEAPISELHFNKYGRGRLLVFYMNSWDELLKGPDFIKSDHLLGSIFCSAPLLGIDIWQEALDHYDPLAEAEVRADLPLEQQQYLSDLRVDRYLYETLAREFEVLAVWERENPNHRAKAEVESFLKRRQRFSERSRIEQQERIFLWAQKNEPDETAVSILGWRLLCRDIAEWLLDWASRQPQDLRGQHIRLWRESPGFYPQNRLRIWALRFLEDARAPQILAWEAATYHEILESHPELVAVTR
jgi:hypothetical protein